MTDVTAGQDPGGSKLPSFADITALLSGDLASNASGWAVDLFSLF